MRKLNKKSWFGAFFALALIVIFGLPGVAHGAAFSGIGSGTEADPYIITTPAQLNEVRNFLGSEIHFRLGNNIDLEAYLAPGGAGYAKWGAEGWEPIGNRDNFFIGSFDGNGHKITGLWIYRRTAHAGLFGVTSATIKNLGVEIAAAGVRGMTNVGGLAGVHVLSSITNSYVMGDVRGGAAVGGLVGMQYHGSSITNSHATGNVSGYREIGGLVGRQDRSSITSSFATGNVSSAIHRGRGGGGLVGVQFWGGSITNSYATGDVSGYGEIGGLVGQIMGSSIINSYATGDVSGYGEIGGLVGVQRTGSIANSFATGDVSGFHGVGGLAGVLCYHGGSITNSFATGNIHAAGLFGGLVGEQRRGSNITNSFRYQFATANNVVLPASDPNGRHGGILTANQLMTQATYSDNGWEFAPSGPWHWDDRGFPKLNIGTETFPFNFSPM